MHITYIFENINLVSTLFKVFVCAEHFAIEKVDVAIQKFRVSVTITITMNATVLPNTET